MSVLKTLTENVVKRNLQHEGAALIQKWEKTGLLEGLDNDYLRNSMSVLLENQAKELLREATTMASGDVDGYAAVAFPIVRRVFGGLIANDLVSVQPMSLPSGLIFFLDFTKGQDRDGPGTDGTSIYGGGVTGAGIMTGVEIDDNEEGFYNLRQGLTAARGGVSPAADTVTRSGANIALDGDLTEAEQQRLQFDADLCSTDYTGTNSAVAVILEVALSNADAHGATNDARATGGADGSQSDGSLPNSDMHRMMRSGLSHLDLTNVNGAALAGHADIGAGARVVRRLTRIVDSAGNPVVRDTFQQHITAGDVLQLVCVAAAVGGFSSGMGGDEAQAALELNFAISDNIDSATSGALGAVEGAPQWQFEDNSDQDTGGIPEIDIQVDSAAVTAATRKLKARWTPELAQDLNAYHNLDAEVELTGVLSEHIALEIDQEILGDLIKGATASTLFWSRNPGQFVNRADGSDRTVAGSPPDFTGTVSEWYETLVETINDVSADIHRKTLRGGANFLVCGPEVANILEFTSGFRASVSHADDKGTVGAVNSGSISKKFDLWVDPYFPRNVILVGRKGGSFLESGYVYAPYVPLQVTPTIFDPDDFTPRKAVMTRYGKKLVSSDMYGLVIVRGLRG